MRNDVLLAIKNHLGLTDEEFENTKSFLLALANEVQGLMLAIRDADSTPEGTYGDELCAKIINDLVGRQVIAEEEVDGWESK